MYSNEQYKKAVKLWLKYDGSYVDVVHELGYPNRRTLKRWCDEYRSNSAKAIVRKTRKRKSKYTTEQKQKAIDYYLEHGKSAARTIRALGYPHKDTFLAWRAEMLPDLRKAGHAAVQYTQQHKEAAVIALCTRKGSSDAVAESAGVTRATLYKWKEELLSKERVMPESKKQCSDLPNDKNKLLQEIETLKDQIQRLKLERDILEAATELIKKDPGVDLKSLSNREKTILIGALKSEHQLKTLISELCISRSSYYYQYSALNLADKYEALKNHIVELFNENKCCYGYRRIHALLSQEGKNVSEKVIRMLMGEAGLVAQPTRKRKYCSYQGEISPAPENLLNRDFHADAPNKKWLTDITEFHIPAGKAYLSPIVDCFDGMLVSWTVSTRPDADMLNTMLDMATGTLTEGDCPIIHSDRGGHYRWPGWLERIDKSRLIRSMSKKGCSPDNAACEGLFGRVKNEMFYNRSWTGVSMDSFIEILDSYLYWYNHKRIKMSLHGMSPVQYRLSLGNTP
jgi:transposase InsO family protein/transposase-like protein